jgi:hypothetical protein
MNIIAAVILCQSTVAVVDMVLRFLLGAVWGT